MHWQDIKREYANVVKNVKHLPRYHDIDPGERAISNSTEKNWNVYMLYLLGYHISEAQFLCPKLCALLRNVPNIIASPSFQVYGLLLTIIVGGLSFGICMPK